MPDSFQRDGFDWIDGVTPVTAEELNLRDDALEAIDDRVNVLETVGGVTPITLTAISGTITPNAAQGSLFRYAASADVALADPTGGSDGQSVTVEVQAVGADRTLTLAGDGGTVLIAADEWWSGTFRYHQPTLEWFLDVGGGGGGGPSLIAGANVTLTPSVDGSSVTIAAATTGASGIPASIVDAKGDLVAGTAADTVARLAAGTDGQVLTASSGQPTGLTWTTPGVTPSDGSITNVKVASGAAITLDKTADYTTSPGRLALTNVERTKIAGLATIATSGSASDLTGGTVQFARLPVGSTSVTVAQGSHTHPASDVTSGTLSAARLGGGTASSGTILYGDSTWRPSGLSVHTVGSSGSSLTLDASSSSGPIKTITLTANCTVTLTGATSGTVATLELIVTQDGTGNRTFIWPGSVKWSGGAPVLSTAGGATDRIVLTSYNGGTTWYGDLVGKSYA